MKVRMRSLLELLNSTSDMEFLEVLTEGLERVLLVRGGGSEVITIYSWLDTQEACTGRGGVMFSFILTVPEGATVTVRSAVRDLGCWLHTDVGTCRSVSVAGAWLDLYIIVEAFFSGAAPAFPLLTFAPAVSVSPGHLPAPVCHGSPTLCGEEKLLFISSWFPFVMFKMLLLFLFEA